MSLQSNLKRVEKGYIFDLDHILKDIALNFDIYTKESNKKIEYSFLYEKYINASCNEKVFQCSAILANGNRCSHKSIKETKFLYCKKHIFKQKSTNTNSDTYLNNLNNINHLNNLNITTNFNSEDTINFEMNNNQINIETDMIQKFINDKLYYMDDRFIYKNSNDSDTLIKCGYISSDNEYIFIDDPYILEMIGPESN